MNLIIDILEERISAAMAAVSGQSTCPAIVLPATDAKFGDYQVNGIMPLAKQLKINPRKLAEDVVKNLSLSDICETPEVAGPGFINLRLKADFIAKKLLSAAKSDRLGIEGTNKPQTIVVDFSGPNIAKQMHVGHLRSTIIGDAICRLLESQGHTVIRQNHIGDWGTQFGKLCAYFDKKILTKPDGDAINGEAINIDETLADIEGFYREANRLYETDEKFAKTARAAVVGLHTGDVPWKTYWEQIVKTTSKHFREIYNRLGVSLEDKDERSESFYKDKLAGVVEDLKKLGLAKESEGAICVFPEGFKDKNGNPLPLIIQKTDGAYLYATTDLAAIRYRVNELKANRVIYVTDARQGLHFEMVFAVARLAGWAKDTELVHVTFGSVLGEDGKPLKTRSGESVKLKELLDEAVERTKEVVEEKNPELPKDEKEKIAVAVGVGAVKYADYSNNRTSDYIFSFDRMLAMEGNTAPYMQYAYARVKSIERKAEQRGIEKYQISNLKSQIPNLIEPAELQLAKHLIHFDEALAAAAADLRHNYLTSYLYELAQKFSFFYADCPVLDCSADKRPTRLLLCDLTARTLKCGLTDLLGIEVVEQM